MPVDTREKRQSAVDLLDPIFAPGVDPSSLDQAGRQASIWVYSGILAGGAPVGGAAPPDVFIRVGYGTECHPVMLGG